MNPMKIHWYRTLTHTLVLSCLAPGLQAANEPQPVKLRLICEHDGIVPGQPFNLGLNIRHDKGWHTYWKNPGDVGMAPSIQWKLPKGFSAKPFQWASPELLKMGIVDVQAFHGEVTHILPMLAPDNLKPGKKITLGGKAAWLMCSKTCIPGYADLEITLPVLRKAKVDRKWEKGFATTRAGFPQVVKGWQVSAKTIGDHVEIEIQPEPAQPQVPLDTYFFCDANHMTTQEKPERVPKGRGLVLRIRKTEWAPPKISRLTGHLHSKKGWNPKGTILNLKVDIPLDK